MAKMKVSKFIEELKRVEKLPTLYELGTFLNRKEGNYLLSDCSGLVKGILWGFPNNGKYASNGVPDNNADTIIAKCTSVSTNFNKITVGEFIWLPGHCGIYIGNGEVIESSPKWENGVQITKLSQRKWKKHGFLPYVEYSSTPSQSETASTIQNNPLINAIHIIAMYVINGTYGNGHDTRKDKIYTDIRNLVNGKKISKTGDLLTALKTVANEVKKGTFGNGHENRSTKIYQLVRDEVNDIL